MQRILIVDDDRVLVDVISFLVRREGLMPTAAYDAASARRLFEEQPPDLIILDVNLVDTDGRDLLREFRKQRPAVLILMLTSLNSEQDRVGSLELGADDYLGKPFRHRELLARIHALLRRTKGDPQQRIPTRIQVGSLMVDPATHEVARSGQPLDLSPTEFRLLQTLVEQPDQLVPTRTILKRVWNHEDMTARNVLRVTAGRLRAKLQIDPSMPAMLQTVPGEGLMIRTDEVADAPAASSTSLVAQAEVVVSSTETIGPMSAESAEQVVALDVVQELRELMTGAGDHPLQQLNDVFVHQVAKDVQSMRHSMTRSDADGVENQAHRLRGTSSSMGALRVTRVCATIEARAHRGELDTLADLLVELEGEVDRYETAIAPMLD